jgi:hypothetical protein
MLQDKAAAGARNRGAGDDDMRSEEAKGNMLMRFKGHRNIQTVKVPMWNRRVV